jgi:hypothetical protein
MTACPSLEELLGLIHETLESRTKTEVVNHLATCSKCVQNQRWLSELLDLTATDESFDFPEDVIQWSVAQFKGAAASSPSRLQIFAKLVFDNLMPAPAAGVRSTAPPSGARQMLYNTGNYDVDIRIEQLSDMSRFHLIGQVMTTENTASQLEGLIIRLTGGASDASAVTDARGMFHLRSIKPGDYDLIITVPEGDIVINAITCRPE